jgi:tetrahydromethanopterin S-methyltransferase subunit C
MTIASHATPRWRRLSALGIGVLAAAAVAGVAVLTVPAWVAAAIGVAVGQAVGTGLEVWDDRHFPDLVMTFEAGLK